MKVSRFRDILSSLSDDDEIIVAWWDYNEIGDRAEEQDIMLSRRQWENVVKQFERRLDIDQPLIEYIDLLVERHGRRRAPETCSDCGEHVEDCNCGYCSECDEPLDECVCDD